MFYDLHQSMMDALRACQTILKYTEGYTLETYQEDYRTICVVERQFEILGEAFNRVLEVDASFRDKIPDVGKAIGMRNRIAHGYDKIDVALIWDATQTNIPPLMLKLSQWLSENTP